tara:strand:- start:2072 stop:2551 length:480 start_codon:yes stop_codon:yes gene_type:complete
MKDSWIDEVTKSLDRQPTVGRLVELCGENYTHLQRLIPELKLMKGKYTSRSKSGKDLHIEVLEHTKYTSSLRMTHHFAGEELEEREPDVYMKVYNDAALAEVLELSQYAIPELSLYEAPGLENKWQVNLFVSKWLSYCVFQGHSFCSSRDHTRASVSRS